MKCAVWWLGDEAAAAADDDDDADDTEAADVAETTADDILGPAFGIATVVTTPPAVVDIVTAPPVDDNNARSNADPDAISIECLWCGWDVVANSWLGDDCEEPVRWSANDNEWRFVTRRCGFGWWCSDVDETRTVGDNVAKVDKVAATDELIVVVVFVARALKEVVLIIAAVSDSGLFSGDVDDDDVGDVVEEDDDDDEDVDVVGTEREATAVVFMELVWVMEVDCFSIRYLAASFIWNKQFFH